MSARRYRFGPLEERRLVGPLRGGQLAAAGIGALSGLVGLYAARSVLGMVLAMLALAGAGAAICVPIGGRTVEEWAPVAARWGLRRRRAAAGYRSSSAVAGTRIAEDGEPRLEQSLPPGLQGIELLTVPYGGGEVGVVRDRAAGTFTAAMAVQPGAFALRDRSEQERVLDEWGEVLASCARDGSPVRRLQWIEQTVPALGDDLAAHFQRHRDREIPLDSDLVRSYVELIEQAAPQTHEHEILLAVQISERDGARELRRLGGGEEAACELVLREAEGLAERLSLAEVSVLGLLRPRQYAGLLRDAFDPFGRRTRDRVSLAEPEREGSEPALMGPQASEESWSRYRSDSAWNTTYWISSWPRSEVGPLFLAPLLMQTQALRTVSVTIEPVP